MRWPSSRDYNEAVQDPSFSFKDAELRAAEATTNAHGLPIARSGGFADVYQLRSTDGKSWAVKCFTKEVSHLHRRYQAISEHLAEARESGTLPFMVDFQYLDDDLRIGSDRYPVLKMAWVEGKLLHDFVREHVEAPTVLEKLSILWHKLGQNLRTAKMAHGDLQHGNVILVPSARGVVPQLIDYDGMYVPALAGTPASEIGHANYQHPGRDADRFHFEMDRFPLLLIYTAIRCLGVGGRKLWEKFDSGDNLLFKEADIKNPASSALCKELWGLPDPAARALVGWVILASRMPLREVPLLDDIIGIDGKRVPALTAKQEAEVRELIAPAPKAVPRVAPPSVPKKTDPPSAPKSKSNPTLVPPTLPPSTAKSEKQSAPRREEKNFDEEANRARRLEILKSALGGVLGLSLLVFLIGKVAEGPSSNPSARRTTSEPPSPRVHPPLGSSPGMPGPPGMTPDGTASPQPKQVSGWRAGPVLKGHTGEVRCVSISADGKRAASGGKDQAIRVWDLETGTELPTLTGHTGSVSSVAISADGKRAISGGDDATVRVWDVDKREEIAQFKLGREVRAVSISADGKRAVSGGMDRAVRVWDIENKTELRSFETHTDDVLSIAISADGKRAVSGSKDRSVRVWDLETNKELYRFSGSASWVACVGISANGKRAISGGSDRTVRMWDLTTGNDLPELGGRADWPRGAALSADGTRAATAVSNGTVRMWEVDKGQVTHLTGHDREATSIALSADGNRAVSGGVDQTVRVWLSPEIPNTTGTPTPPKTTIPPTARVELVAAPIILRAGQTQAFDVSVMRRDFSGPLTLTITGLPAKVTAKPITVPEGDDIARIEVVAAADVAQGKTTARLEASVDGTVLKEPFDVAVVVVINAPTSRYPALAARTWVLGVAVSADGKRAITGGNDKTVSVWDLETGKVLHQLTGHSDEVLGVAISADGKRGVSGGWDKTVRVWNLETGKELHRLTGHTELIGGVAISADGKRAVSGGGDKTVFVWDLEAGKELYQLSGHVNSISKVAISADGKRAVSCGPDPIIRVWDLEKGKELYQLTGHVGLVISVGISADGKRVISGGSDDTVQIWDLETGKRQHRLTGHISTVYGVAMTADGKRAISGGIDHSVRVWDAEIGKELYQLPGHTASVHCVAISADGLRAVSCSDDKAVRVWDLPAVIDGARGKSESVPDDRLKKLIGTWEQIDGKGAFWEFTEDGRIIRTVGIKIEGTYKLDGDKLETTLPSKGLDRKTTYTIKKLTDDELIYEYSKGGESKFRKLKPK